MGMRIERRGQIGVNLKKHAERSTRALRRVQAQGAEEIADTATQMAPFKTGQLEGSIEANREVGSGGVVSYSIEAVGLPYAVKMHEAHYNLGPGSLEKSKNSPFMVGRKYLSRAVDYVVNELQLLERMRRAARMK